MGGTRGQAVGNDNYLKKHSEALVKDVGIEAACALTGKSKATLGRYYSDLAEQDDRANQLVGVLLGPGECQPQLRPVVGRLALGPLAGCHAGSLHAYTTRRS